jgi:hypothetical protein
LEKDKYLDLLVVSSLSVISEEKKAGD